MLQSLFTMFRNDAKGTLHNSRIAYDLRYDHLKKQGYQEMQCHAMGLAQMANNFFAAHKRNAALIAKANINLAHQDAFSIQIMPFVYTFSLQGKEACAHYFAWLRHGLDRDIDEELIQIAVRRGLNQLAGHGQQTKVVEAIAAKPAWLVFAPEWSEYPKK